MPDTGSHYARSLMMHRAPLLELLGQIPADQGEFAAWDGGMSFKRLTDHLNSTTSGALALFAGQTPIRPEPSLDLPAAVARLRENTDHLRSTLEEASAEQLSKVVPAFGKMEMPFFALMDFTMQHDAHHKGQVWMMARMINIEPPMFVKLG
jgi:uncharacterized damage-inducible protein DinB